MGPSLIYYIYHQSDNLLTQTLIAPVLPYMIPGKKEPTVFPVLKGVGVKALRLELCQNVCMVYVDFFNILTVHAKKYEG